MLIKIIVTISIIIIYSTIFGLMVRSFREQYECLESFSCFRFCSTDTEKYSDKFLAEDFVDSKSGEKLRIDRVLNSSDIDDIKFYRGPPVCGGLSYLPSKNESSLHPSPYGVNFVSIDCYLGYDGVFGVILGAA